MAEFLAKVLILVGYLLEVSPTSEKFVPFGRRAMQKKQKAASAKTAPKA